MKVRGLRQRINEKCRDCVYDPANRGTWREQTYLCTVTDCPLWDVRPTPTKGSTARADQIAEEESRAGPEP